MVHGAWSMIRGQWSMDHGPWTMVGGPWSVENVFSLGIFPTIQPLPFFVVLTSQFQYCAANAPSIVKHLALPPEKQQKIMYCALLVDVYIICI